MTTMPTETTFASELHPSFSLSKIDPKFDLFSSVDDYRFAVQEARRDKDHHVRLLRKAGLVGEARSLQRCDGADKPCGRGDCPVCKLEHDRALNAEVLQLLAAHDNRGYFVNLSVASEPSEKKISGDAVALFCQHLLQGRLDQGGYCGIRVIGSLRLVHYLDRGWKHYDYSLVVLGATPAQIGGLWDRLRPSLVGSVRKIGPKKFNILKMTDGLRTFSGDIGTSHVFGNGIEPPTPAQLFHLRWFATLRLENCTFRYGLAQAEAEQAA